MVNFRPFWFEELSISRDKKKPKMILSHFDLQLLLDTFSCVLAIV